MKEIDRLSKVLLIALTAAFCYIIYLQNKPVKVEVKKEIVSRTDTVRDTVFKDIIKKDYVKVQIPKYVYVDCTRVDPGKLYTGVSKDDTLTLDYSILVDQNELKDFKYKYSIKYKEVNTVVTNTVEKEILKYRRGFYLGSQLGVGLNGVTITPTVMLQNKKGYIYSLGYEVVNRNLEFGINVPLITY